MRIVIVAVEYLEPEYRETRKCIEATGLPVVWVDRKGVNSLAKAHNEGFEKAKALEPDLVWFVTNVTFDPELPQRLADNIGKHAAIHPKFNSDHVHMKSGVGVKEVPFVEFTAPMVKSEVFDQFRLDEKMPFWGHDLDWGYRVWQAGYSIAVDYTNEVGHVYIRHSKPHPVTKQRLANRRATDNQTRLHLASKYGQEWRDVVFPKSEKDIVNFYNRIKAKINRDSAKVIVCDLDGVLTDGKVWVDNEGKITKGFHTKDLAAIKQLIANGYEFHIVTASSWSGAYNYLKKSGAVLHTIRNKENIPFNFDIAIGDSSWDLPMLYKAKEAFCPADAALEVKTLDGINVLETKGGEGVILEMARILCKST